MISLFSSKVSLKSLLHSQVDIHCHLLPDIDDGAANIEVSFEMLQWYEKLGYKKIICTPHIMEDQYRLNKQKIDKELEVFKPKAQQTFPEIELFAAAEHLADKQFETLLQNDLLAPLTDSIVLFETGFLMRPLNLNKLIFDMQNKGYLPVLAHPERYNYISSEKEYRELKSRGVLLQLNMLSVTGHYGRNIQQKSEMLLTKGYIDYIGTDAHRPEHLEKIWNAKISKKLVKPLEVVLQRTNEIFG
ncbi:tyrosine-protein phosphatase [Robertkochia aurantiaca]|uniref:tyrosine-protein phosphatase n=1 Tax=Robertkochia aurantiaca TaxID=2873700 RepID=UPI001CCACE01|nr:CpsB/CapC family capsule biosynthesis tyrosine phosphatase [Robertkochia sp. 3YJGBD-33]